MTPFARYFKLKDPDRVDFRLHTNNTDHLRLYIDQNGSLDEVQAALGESPPLLVVEGDFGTGKSHLLRYVERVLLEAQSELSRHFEPVYVSLSGFHRRSDFLTVHQQIAPLFIEKATAAMQAPGPDRAARAKKLDTITENMRRALHYLGLAGVGTDHADATSAKQWLSASSKLTSARMTKAGFTATFFEEAGPSRIVDLYKAISALFKSVFGKRLLLLLDEGESFSRVVDTDAQAHIGGGMRTLFDTENQSLGCFLGLNTPRARRLGVHSMLRSDVQSRVSNRQIQLSSFTSPKLVAEFMDNLWPKMTTDTGSLPFLLDRSAFEFVTQYLDELRRRLVLEEDQLSPSPSQRDLLAVLSDIGKNAVKRDPTTPIRTEQIRRWYGMTKA